MTPYDYLFENNQPSLKTLSFSELNDFVVSIDSDVVDMYKAQKNTEYNELIAMYLKARKQAEKVVRGLMK